MAGFPSIPVFAVLNPPSLLQTTTLHTVFSLDNEKTWFMVFTDVLVSLSV